MSIILDALRKSESERQRQAGAVIADSGYRPAAQRRSLWVPVLAVVLLANLVAFGVFWWRSESRSGPATGAPEAAALPAPAPEPVVVRPASAARIAGTEEVAVPAGTPAATTAADAGATPAPGTRGEVLEPPPAATAPAAQPGSPGSNGLATGGGLPSAEQMMTAGLLTGPSLHVDLHVYSRKPAERFAVINMKRYGEGAELPEGVRVEEITQDGVVLSKNGSRFLLPRE